jgi:hypothetical protein
MLVIALLYLWSIKRSGSMHESQYPRSRCAASGNRSSVATMSPLDLLLSMYLKRITKREQSTVSKSQDSSHMLAQAPCFSEEEVYVYIRSEKAR